MGLLEDLVIVLSTPIYPGQTVVVSYNQSVAGGDALADAAGNEVASFTTGRDGVTAVTNNSTVPPPTTCTLNPGDRWCGVVTVGTYSNGVGFTDSDGALTDNTGDQTIAIASGNYTVSSVVILASPAGALVMGLDTRFPTGDETSLVFHIGSSTFKVSEATFDTGVGGYIWQNSGLSWSVGDMVDVRLRRTTGGAVVPVVTIAADEGTVIENTGAAGFTLSRTGPTTATLTVTVEVTQEVDRDLLPDGAAAERTVTFAVDSATTALMVALEDDDLAEVIGELTVEVQAGMGYTVGDPGSATVDVTDVDSGRPTPANLMAEAGAGVGEVALSWDAYAPGLQFRRHQYRYKTDGNYAEWTDISNSGLNHSLGGDGSNLTGYTVTGLVGGQVHTFQVRTYNSSSSASDPSDEATATPRSAAVIPPLEVTLQLSDDKVFENGQVTVMATVSPVSPVAFTVTISATPVAPATADDFTLSTNRVLRFAADATESTGTVTIRPFDDDIPEPHDVEVSAPAAVDEGAVAAVVTLTLTTRQNTAPVATVEMFFVVEGGTATRGDDYTPPPGRDFGTTSGIHFDTVRPSAFSPNAAGTAWVAAPSFTIGIIDDQEAEVAETIVFTVKFSEVESPAHTITIRDNDAVASDRPTDLQAAPRSPTVIQLAWTAPSAGSFSITGYRVEASENASGPWVVVAADTRNTRTNKPHGGLSAGDTRHYRVSAISPAGTSGPSNVASATTIAAGPAGTNAALPPPQDVNAEPKLPGEIRLSWWRNTDAPSHDLVDRHQYRYRVRDAGAWTVDWTTVNQTQTMPPPGTAETRNYNSVLLQELTAGTIYEFQVRAVDKADGTSAAGAALGTATGRQTVWIVADVGSVAEGEPLRFTVWRDQRHGPMVAIVRISETGDMLPPDGRSPEGRWHEQVHFGDGN